MGYDYAYTNADVRGDRDLYQMAVDYAEGYTGDFRPLVEARNMLIEGVDLPTQVARVVLNCMRHDADICDRMPQPKRTLRLVEDGPRATKPIHKQCGDTNSHLCHWITSDTLCDGIPWEINRNPHVHTTAKVKYAFAVARSGNLVHKTTGKAKMFWLPRIHAEGFVGDPSLYVDLVCKYPSVLRDPILLKEEPSLELDVRKLARCIRGCF